jgi:uncharacterized protein YdeI (YjbR/CyaY-like superfamily)
MAGGGGIGSDEFWERQVRVRSQEVARLQEELEMAYAAASDAAARAEAAGRAAAAQQSAAAARVAQLEAELKERPSAEVFRELHTRAAALQQLVDVQVRAVYHVLNHD